MKRHRSNERNGAFFMSSGGKSDKGANIYEYFHTANTAHTSILHIHYIFITIPTIPTIPAFYILHIYTDNTDNTDKKHIQIEKILYKQHDICDILPQRIIEKISVSLVLGKLWFFRHHKYHPYRHASISGEITGEILEITWLRYGHP